MVHDHIIRNASGGSNRETSEKYWIADQMEEVKSFISHIEKFSKTAKIEFI